MSRKSLVPIELPRDPALPLEAVTKQYVDAANSAEVYRELDNQWKKSVQCATTGPIANLSNLGLNPTIDGVTITEGMRVLVKDQANNAQNGIYMATNSPPWLLQRGYVVWQEVYQSVVAVDAGTVNHDTIWMSTADAGGTLNTTPVSFVKLAMQSDVVASVSFTPAQDWFTSAALTAIPATTYVTVGSWTRVAGVAAPGYFTSISGAGVFTIAVAGLYYMNFSAAFAAGTDGRRLILIFLNGVEDRRQDITSAVTCTVGISHTRYLAVGNTIEFKMYCTGGATAMANPGHDCQFIRLA